MKSNTYIFFDGNCAEALERYEKTLGAKVESAMKNAGTPAAEEVPATGQDKILHARVTIGDQVYMASDAPPGHYQRPQGCSIALTVGDAAEAERVHGVLADGGKVAMPLAETFFAERFSMVTDRYGIPWMVNFPGNKQK